MEVWGRVGPRGSEIFSCDDGHDWEWARCHKAECDKFVCRGLSDIWCYVHVDGLPTLAEIIECVPVNPPECRHEFQCDGWTVDPQTSTCHVCKCAFVFWSKPQDATSFTFPEDAGS